MKSKENELELIVRKTRSGIGGYILNKLYVVGESIYDIMYIAKIKSQNTNLVIKLKIDLISFLEYYNLINLHSYLVSDLLAFDHSRLLEALHNGIELNETEIICIVNNFENLSNDNFYILWFINGHERTHYYYHEDESFPYDYTRKYFYDHLERIESLDVAYNILDNPTLIKGYGYETETYIITDDNFLLDKFICALNEDDFKMILGKEDYNSSLSRIRKPYWGGTTQSRSF